MPKILRILPYKPGSRSCRILARSLNGLRVRQAGNFRPRLRHLVVNWGNPRKPHWWIRGLNNPDAVGRSSNKLTALTILKEAGVSIPQFTVNHEEAAKWVGEAGKIVVGRRVLNGSKGIGCVIYRKEDGAAIVNFNCPLYTLHLRHKREFRIHVFKGRVIDMVEKRKRRGFEDRNAYIRNYHNGYVFTREGLQVPDCVSSEAIRATAVLGLDFGAVDVAFREKENKAYVFEVNTAPGIEGTTIQSYIRALKQELENG